MEILPPSLVRRLPPLYSTEGEADPMVICKFFLPDFHWSWYVIEFDGHDLFFGFVDGDCPELGYFRLSELQQVRGKLGLPLERDLTFQPCRLSTLMARCQR